jgi:hypothetical protein
MTVDERDIDLLKEFMEVYNGNLKSVEDHTNALRTQIKQMYMKAAPTSSAANSTVTSLGTQKT